MGSCWRVFDVMFLILVIYEEKELLEFFVKVSLYKKIENENEILLFFSNRDILGCN